MCSGGCDCREKIDRRGRGRYGGRRRLRRNFRLKLVPTFLAVQHALACLGVRVRHRAASRARLLCGRFALFLLRLFAHLTKSNEN
jgi:hypothetical protein